MARSDAENDKRYVSRFFLWAVVFYVVAETAAQQYFDVTEGRTNARLQALEALHPEIAAQAEQEAQ